MSNRPTKRARILSSEEEDSESTDWAHEGVSRSGSQTQSVSRARRGPSASTANATSDPNKQSIRLTVKAPPSRLREVTTNSNNNAREKLGRSSKRAPIIDRSESDEDDEAEDDDDDQDDDEDEDEHDADDDEEEEDAATDADDNDDDDEEGNVPAPRIKINGPQASKKSSPGRVLKQGIPTKSVEDKEMQNASSDDEELSSEPDDEGEGDEEEAIDSDDEEDMEMMDEDGADLDDTINSAAIGENELDSEDGEGSESGTPDPSKLTRRQRGEAESDLMALSNEAQKKKFFTAEQITMRRAEMARRRKDLSDKRNQNEKEDTLRRLLHKPAPKRRSRAQMIADAEREEFGTPGAEGDESRPSKLYVRTVMRTEGSSVSVPVEWLGTPAGRIFESATMEEKRQEVSSSSSSTVSRMVEVIE